MLMNAYLIGDNQVISLSVRVSLMLWLSSLGPHIHIFNQRGQGFAECLKESFIVCLKQHCSIKPVYLQLQFN